MFEVLLAFPIIGFAQNPYPIPPALGLIFFEEWAYGGASPPIMDLIFFEEWTS